MNGIDLGHSIYSDLATKLKLVEACAVFQGTANGTACMGCGRRSIAHTRLKLPISELSSKALFTPHLETRPFPSDPGA